MQVAILVLQIVLLLVTVVCALWMMRSATENVERAKSLCSELGLLRTTVADNPRTQNVIHLDLSGSDLRTGIKPTEVPVDTAIYKPNRDRLHKLLVRAYETEKHPSVQTLAYIILERAGIYQLVTGKSTESLKAALTRLLINADDKAIRGFLKTVSESL